MVVFTTLEHLNRRGVATKLARRHGRDYQLVVIDHNPVDVVRRQLSRAKAKRLIATIPSRDDVVLWLRQHDGPGVPWPRYALEGI